MGVALYVRGETVVIPTKAKTAAGFWLEVEPVQVVPRSGAELRRALARAILRGNPSIATPPREQLSVPVVLKACGVSSYSAFAKSASRFSIEVANGIFTLIPHVLEGKSWVQKPEMKVETPDLDLVANLIVEYGK